MNQNFKKRRHKQKGQPCHTFILLHQAPFSSVYLSNVEKRDKYQSVSFSVSRQRWKESQKRKRGAPGLEIIFNT